MFEIIPRFENRGVHFLHCIPELHTEATEDVALPCVVLRIHTRLDLLIVYHTRPEVFLRFRRIERRSRFLDLREQLLPTSQRVSKSVEDVFRLKIPK